MRRSVQSGRRRREDQRRYVEFLQIFREVGLREGLNAIDDAFEPRQHSLEPERIAQTLRNFAFGRLAP